MICRLISYDLVIPGQYRYEDRQNGSHKFGPNPSIVSLAEELASFRSANKLKRATYDECVIDIDRYNAQRLGCNRLWCVPVDAVVIQTEAAARRGTGCRGCGAVAH